MKIVAQNDKAWVAVFTANFRDEDWPVRQIVSAKSQLSFEQMVNDGVHPPPSAMLWHESGWTFGKGLGVETFSVELGEHIPGMEEQAVFSLAYGVSLDGEIYEKVNRAVNQKADALKVSHGMPGEFLKFGDNGMEIIDEHVSREVSYLPAGKEALPQTAAVAITPEVKEKLEKMIDDKKTGLMAKALNVEPSVLKELEMANLEVVANFLNTTVEQLEGVKQELIQSAVHSVLAGVPTKEKSAAPDTEEKEAEATDVQETEEVEEVEEAVEDEDVEDDSDVAVVTEAQMKEFSDSLVEVVKGLQESIEKLGARLDEIEAENSATVKALKAEIKAVGQQEQDRWDPQFSNALKSAVNGDGNKPGSDKSSGPRETKKGSGSGWLDGVISYGSNR